MDGHEIICLLRSIDRRLGWIAKESNKRSLIRLDTRSSHSRIEAARFLGVSVWTIDRARKDGLLHETRRVGPRNVRITGESILAFQCEREKQRTASEVMQI